MVWKAKKKGDDQDQEPTKQEEHRTSHAVNVTTQKPVEHKKKNAE
jgi:hypothetical protein